MEWEVWLHQDIADKLKKLPADWKPQFDAAFKKLGSDPKGLGHSPVLPYAWRGPSWDFRVKDSSGHMLHVTLHFLFDDDPAVAKIYVRDMSVISVYYGERKTGESAASKTRESRIEDSTIIEIPALPPMGGDD